MLDDLSKARIEMLARNGGFSHKAIADRVGVFGRCNQG
jgi:hypothetical protein